MKAAFSLVAISLWRAPGRQRVRTEKEATTYPNAMHSCCPQCQRSLVSTHHGGLFTDRCVSCGWNQSGTANSPAWFSGQNAAVETEQPFWLSVVLRQPLTASQMRALRAVEPGSDGTESAQSFIARARSASEQRIGPYWSRQRALDALRTLSEAGLEGVLASGPLHT